MLVAPAIDTDYWFIEPGDDNNICCGSWDGYAIDIRRLASGMCWLTGEDATAAVKALTAILKGD